MNSEHFSGLRGDTGDECIAGPAWKPRSAMGGLGGRSRRRTKRVRAEPAPCWAGAAEDRAAGATRRGPVRRRNPLRARASEFGILRGRRAEGGRLATAATTVEEERRLALLWRRRRGEAVAEEIGRAHV